MELIESLGWLSRYCKDCVASMTIKNNSNEQFEITMKDSKLKAIHLMVRNKIQL